MTRCESVEKELIGFGVAVVINLTQFPALESEIGRTAQGSIKPGELLSKA